MKAAAATRPTSHVKILAKVFEAAHRFSCAQISTLAKAFANKTYTDMSLYDFAAKFPAAYRALDDCDQSDLAGSEND